MNEGETVDDGLGDLVEERVVGDKVIATTFGKTADGQTKIHVQRAEVQPPVRPGLPVILSGMLHQAAPQPIHLALKAKAEERQKLLAYARGELVLPVARWGIRLTCRQFIRKDGQGAELDCELPCEKDCPSRHGEACLMALQGTPRRALAEVRQPKDHEERAALLARGWSDDAPQNDEKVAARADELGTALDAERQKMKAARAAELAEQRHRARVAAGTEAEDGSWRKAR